MGPRREHRAERRAELLATAISAVRDHGADCSIDDIARRVGVTRPVIYRYFDGRDGVAKAIGAHTAERVRAEMLAAMERESEGKALLAAGIGAYLAFIEDDPQLYRYLLRGPLRRADGGYIGDFVDRLGREMAAVIGDVLAAADRDTGNAEPWAFAIIGMVGVTGEWWLDRGSMSRQRLATYLTDLLWDGIGGAVAPVATADDGTTPTTDELARRRRA